MRILVIAPHNDDEVLGVGGTMAKFAKMGYEVYVCEITSSPIPEKVDNIQKEALKAHNILGVKETIFLGLPVVGLKETPSADINSKILEVVDRIKPNIAFIPHKGDMHIDHGEVARSSMVALRPVNNPQLKAIYAYETLSETEWNTPSIDNAFIPNVWIDISNTIDIKLQAMECYQSQLKEFPNPRSLKAIRALAEFRGSTVCVNSAESFMLLRGKL
ncbi:putative LmbE-like protein [Schinkia azotoformans MEV2011]|uniref:Putative LmbE-like protein n=1 Tax=Schinkia azotoformans MEV2011 TaxID=1348973 RepID=A0A072NN24_SCHAZ|nr:PIG-L deacetylase family protein [Schinkia azotoformans]KEF38871.1 putative LmbE-like protein [Schinkia azotoformans MEV2011]MEC1696774.1 PIG-L family deacetylase [Schinkia azotoformans]MEC1725017.1 PIG-L family deacetylase [Schinkia azotoformans]MEC1741748.1 PIG-L family deacetylase [Schinkia azotoformans]MEC1766574.1 PIG-L family deacetylase [Schinkia azotoformans]